MLLFLLRHASAENSSKTGKDFDRPLSDEGLNQATQLRKYVSNLHLTETNFYVSSSQRTKETSIIALNLNENRIHFTDQLYLSSSLELLKFINSQCTTKDMLLLGHNEGISALASYLTNQNISLNTANCVTIKVECENSSEISQGMGNVLEFFSPI